MTPERWRQVTDVFHAALTRGSSERLAFLDQACAGDAALRLEVDAMLAAQSSAGNFGERPVGLSTLDARQLDPGAMLGPYRIEAMLGAGGMGEVYRATDTRLHRAVAIKVLPEALAADRQLRERFDREARAISQLDHPHICALYDVGEQDGRSYLVMQYLEGETLEARLKKGALPLAQALQFATQMADALDKAHRTGIAHRDLKPGNIMLTKSGAKILDFGLAKAGLASLAGIGPSILPTTPPALTEQGTILGTFQYMAPEQIEGKTSDARSDIFAFGAVLYEMLTGRKAFEGETRASLIGAIMHAHPAPIARLQPLTPPALDRIVLRCLAKDPDNRVQTARDLVLELAWITERTVSGVGAPADVRPSRPSPWTRRAVGTAMIVTGFVAGALVGARYLAVRDEPRAVYASILPPERESYSPAAANLSVSPDGQQVSFVASASGGKTLLWVRRLDAPAARALPGTDDAVAPFWSADSRFLGFFAQGKLKKIAVGGGPPQALCDASDGRGGSWSRSGVIVFARNLTDVVYRVSDSGGQPTAVTKLDASNQEIAHLWPEFLPDGRRFLYLAWSDHPENRRLSVGDIGGGPATPLLNIETNAAFASGHLLFVRDATLMAQAFSATTLTLSSEAMPIADRVRSNPDTGRAPFSVSPAGVLAYRSGVTLNSSQLVWVDRTGRVLGRIGEIGDYNNPELSPDNKSVAVQWRRNLDARMTDIWSLDAETGTPSRLTSDAASDSAPIWAPDGRHIVFASNRDSPRGAGYLYKKPTSAIGADELILRGPGIQYPQAWSPDGHLVVYVQIDSKTKSDLWSMPASGGAPTPLIQTKFNEQHAQFSPDGRWLAFASDETGQYEVYVRRFPSGGEWPVSTGGGVQPRWRGDGKELFYLGLDRKMMAAAVETASGVFHAGTPQALFQTNVYGPGMIRLRDHYSVTSDGQRFLINSLSESSTSSPITAVLNWMASLK